uniref:Uncharacterized protein n=1 Tax=Arundo donax TaxID=35708 RepID=A0A0A9FVT5_ARUDO
MTSVRLLSRLCDCHTFA